MNSARQSRESMDESRLYVFSPLSVDGAWSAEASTLIKSSNPALDIQQVDIKSDFSQMAQEGLSILIFEIKTAAQVEPFLKVLRFVVDKVRKKNLMIVLLTQSGAHEAISHLELNGTVQVLSPLISPKALKVKIDFLFARLKQAKKAVQSAEVKNITIKAELKIPAPHLKVPDNVVNFKKVNPAVRAEEQPASASAEPVPKSRSIALISPRALDLELVGEIAVLTKSSFHYYHQVDEDLLAFLRNHRHAVIFWDVDSEQISDDSSPHSASNVAQSLAGLIPKEQVFAISNKNISRLPKFLIEKRRAFSHCLLRAKTSASVGIYAKIVDRVVSGAPFAIDPYFDTKPTKKSFSISQASQRTTAVLGVERFFISGGLLPRIAVQAARAADELILNAIQDAPIDSRGQHYRHGLVQPANYKFNEKEKITLSAFKNDEYCAIFVQDHFGSLDSNLLFDFLQKTGLGLNSVVETGFSLHAVIQPGEMTVVSIFFPNVKTYVSFRKAFRFFSVTVIPSP